MCQVVLRSWEPGLRKVSLTKLLRDRSELLLPEAKAAVDALLNGQRVWIQMQDAGAAASLLADAGRLGAVGELRDDT